MFELPIFKTEEYYKFRDTLTNHISAATNPRDIAIDTLLPVIIVVGDKSSLVPGMSTIVFGITSLDPGLGSATTKGSINSLDPGLGSATSKGSIN